MNKEAFRNIVGISFNHKLSHLGSNLSALPIIEEIYNLKQPNEPFVLSSGHAGLALYAVLEQRGYGKALDYLEACGIHPDRQEALKNGLKGIDCSTGSLGQGLPIATGLALADRSRRVWCLISDGEAAEGSIYEALNVKQQQQLDNLEVFVNINQFGAYRGINPQEVLPSFPELHRRYAKTNWYPDWLKGQKAHYVTMNQAQYEDLLGYVI